MKPYALHSGEGWVYRYGVDFVVKAGEVQAGRGGFVSDLESSQGQLIKWQITPSSSISVRSFL
jgi:hypothetical protein